MNQNIESIINKCLIEHAGGEIFFDAIDEEFRNDEKLLTMMTDKVNKNEVFDYIIVSGKFGKVFKNFCIDNNIYPPNSIITVNGSLRKDQEVQDYSKNYNLKNKNVIFIDDSFYLGRTRDKIKNSIIENKGNLISTYVFYDGSKIKDKSVHSFYRYYDHFPIIDKSEI